MLKRVIAPCSQVQTTSTSDIKVVYHTSCSNMSAAESCKPQVLDPRSPIRGQLHAPPLLLARRSLPS
jgi:hypothetical protein